MYTNRIITGILFVIALAALVIFFPVLPIVLGIWGIVALVGIALIVIGLAAALVLLLVSKKNVAFLQTRNIATSLGSAVLVFALIVGFGLILLPKIDTNANVATSTTTTPTETIAPTAPAPTATLAVVDPALEHGTYPQVQIGHPNFYVETGTNATYKWTFEVKDQEIGIVGGLVVDGKNGGVYRAYGPGKYTVEVQNGFVLTTQKEWGQNEFMFRIGQAVKYNWAYGTVDYGPLTPPSK